MAKLFDETIVVDVFIFGDVIFVFVIGWRFVGEDVRVYFGYGFDLIRFGISEIKMNRLMP